MYVSCIVVKRGAGSHYRTTEQQRFRASVLLLALANELLSVNCSLIAYPFHILAALYRAHDPHLGLDLIYTFNPDSLSHFHPTLSLDNVLWLLTFNF